MTKQLRNLRHGYHELQDYNLCPRLWSWKGADGWIIAPTDAMLSGTLVHLALAAYFSKTSWETALATELQRLLKVRPQDSEAIKTSYVDARKHFEHYLLQYAKDFTPVSQEEHIVIDGVPGTIDLVAVYKSKLVLVDFKHVSYPNSLAYRVSGQLDMYAFMYEHKYGRAPDLVIYDLISDKGIMRVEYPPDLAKGCYLYVKTQELTKLEAGFARQNPNYGWHCHDCKLVQACHLLDSDGKEAAEDWLKSNLSRNITEETYK